MATPSPSCVFVPETPPPDELRCPECHDLLYSAVEFVPCGHVLCGRCRDVSHCPVCREPVDERRDALCFIRELAASLPGRCAGGCGFVGNRAAFEAAHRRAPSQPASAHSAAAADMACVICFGSPRNVVFQPCRHFAACAGCSSKLNRCPFCRVLIVEKITIYVL